MAWYSQKIVGALTPHGCGMLWNFFCSSHGKGEHDGTQAMFKRELHKEQLRLNAPPLWNAFDAMKFL